MTGRGWAALTCRLVLLTLTIMLVALAVLYFAQPAL